MSNEPSGIGLEISQLTTVGVFMAAILPGFLWVRKSSNPGQMVTRSAVVGVGLLTAALYTGFKERS